MGELLTFQAAERAFCWSEKESPFFRLGRVSFVKRRKAEGDRVDFSFLGGGGGRVEEEEEEERPRPYPPPVLVLGR